MKTKLGYIVLLLFVAVPVSLLSQEHGMMEEHGDIDLELAHKATWPPNLLIHADNTIIVSSFQFLDGTRMSMRETSNLIRTVPANQTLMRQIRRGTTASLIAFGLLFAATVTLSVSTEIDLPNANIVRPIGLGVVAGSGLTLAYLTGIRTKRYLRAVDNYNLYVLGIPQQ